MILVFSPRLFPWLAGGLMLTSLTGCQEEPSFRLRWEVLPRIGDEVGPDLRPGLENPVECSRVGVVAVEITTRDALRDIVDQRVRPCFPPGFADSSATVGGPNLSSGPYEVIARGVQRNGVGWISPDVAADVDPAPRCGSGGVEAPCGPGVLVCDCRFIDVEEDETVIVDDLVFEPPPECEDGIDNDRDGLVDQRDPGCRLAGRESDDVSTVQFQLRIGLLGNNPNVVCSGLNIARYLISFDDQILDDPLCSAVPSFFSVDAAAGEYEVTVVAIDAAGEPRTTTWTQTIEIPEGGGGSFELDVQFDDITFLEPIVAGAPMTLSFIPQADQPAHGCISGGLGSDLTEVRIHVLDAHGGELDPPVLLEDGVTPLVGQWIPCPAATLETEPLAWGGYLAHIEARNATGDVCFATADPIPLAPRVSRPLRVPAVPDAPESCR